MASTFALFTTHPGLVQCQLARLEGRIDLQVSERVDTIGVGSFVEEGILHRRLARSAAPALSELFSDVGTEALIAHAQRLGSGHGHDEDLQPLRFRHWLFALEGALPEFARLRPTLEAGLPDYLKRHLRTETPAEAALALFLTGLRDIGRTDDPALEPKLAAQILGRAARQLSRLSADAGASRAASFQLVCSNGQMLLAARLGGEPLHYTLLEGQDACELCGVVPGTPEQLPAARAHLRCRSVAVATHVRNGHWVELDSGQVLAVNPRAELELVPF